MKFLNWYHTKTGMSIVLHIKHIFNALTTGHGGVSSSYLNNDDMIDSESEIMGR